jgi:hypothetical protein
VPEIQTRDKIIVSNCIIYMLFDQPLQNYFPWPPFYPLSFNEMFNPLERFVKKLGNQFIEGFSFVFKWEKELEGITGK